MMKRLLMLFLSSTLFFASCGEEDEEKDEATTESAISCNFKAEENAPIKICMELQSTDEASNKTLKDLCTSDIGTYADSACDVPAGTGGCQQIDATTDGVTLKGTQTSWYVAEEGVSLEQTKSSCKGTWITK